MILDHIENLEITETDKAEHYEARMALARLGEGLFWMYGDVLSTENKVRKRAEKDDVQFDPVGGVLEGFALGRLSCAFQWYAVSACNYALLVGWLTTFTCQERKRLRRARHAPPGELP